MRQRGRKPPGYPHSKADAKKMKSLTLPTYGILKASLTDSSSNHGRLSSGSNTMGLIDKFSDCQSSCEST